MDDQVQNRHWGGGQCELQGECTIHLKPGAVQTVQPVRRITSALHNKLENELKQLKEQGIIHKVTNPKEDLNATIQRPYYPMPTFEDVAAWLYGHKRFTKLVAKFGYWMPKLSEQSSIMTTFNTPFRRYRHIRMPFGNVCAQDIFQQKMKETFSNLEGVKVIADDIIVSGKDDEHDRKLVCMLERTRKEEKLAAFDAQSKEVELKTDASKYGLGAELPTHEKIVAFASKALNETEQCYSQVEKELYAIMSGCQKFHQYVYGRKIKLYTDHKPLETILSKPLSQAPPRMQRIMLQIQPYNLEAHCIRDKDIPAADALSRMHPSENDEFQNEIEFHLEKWDLSKRFKKLKQCMMSLSQETFDAVVRENIELFDLKYDAAVQDAIKQFSLQVVIESCELIRNILSDDDIREEFNQVQLYAKLLVEEHKIISVATSLLKEHSSSAETAASLLSTLSNLAIRNEFCQEIADHGGLSLVFETLAVHATDRSCAKWGLALIKALAGNDDIKHLIGKMDGIPPVVLAIMHHLSIPAVCETGCLALAALALRHPQNAQRICDASGHTILVDALKIHETKPRVIKAAAKAIRDVVSRDRSLAHHFLDLSVEELLNAALKKYPKQCESEVKAALRDLGCDIHLKEYWHGGINPVKLD
ncbi:hypothetical protein QYM36_016793 [Artemia franciscana]|uniref:Reverse transcriptase RNase H-like domain-containing protein n=1 Tax=Artemia franciscana TaxID=6661 RepID=A0AA88HCH3_ARTSF|nr:hypothetical protein QYM36_016793 [Artemia franciscana]